MKWKGRWKWMEVRGKAMKGRVKRKGRESGGEREKKGKGIEGKWKGK